MIQRPNHGETMGWCQKHFSIKGAESFARTTAKSFEIVYIYLFCLYIIESPFPETMLPLFNDDCDFQNSLTIPWNNQPGVTAIYTTVQAGINGNSSVKSMQVTGHRLAASAEFVGPPSGCGDENPQHGSVQTFSCVSSRLSSPAPSWNVKKCCANLFVWSGWGFMWVQVARAFFL